LFAGVPRIRKYEGDPVEARRALNEDFEDAMEDIATAAWYGDGRTASIQEVRTRCSDRVSRGAGKGHFVRWSTQIDRGVLFFKPRKGTRPPEQRHSNLLTKASENISRRVGSSKTWNKCLTGLSLKRDYFTTRHALENWFDLAAPNRWTRISIALFATKWRCHSGAIESPSSKTALARTGKAHCADGYIHNSLRHHFVSNC